MYIHVLPLNHGKDCHNDIVIYISSLAFRMSELYMFTCT